MAIINYRGPSLLSPWRELDEVSTHLNRLFGDRLRPDVEAGTGTWVPAVNVEEDAEALMLTAELPGLADKDVEIEIENNVLTIRGRKVETHESDADRRFHVWERRYGAFQRSFSLPRTVKADAITANFRDGVLHVHLPKAAEAKGRKIEVRSGA